MQRSKYLSQLKEAIRAVHGCESLHVSTSRVVSQFEGETAWDGEVETFDLNGHPKAKRCHAWGYVEKGSFKATAVLELPPVDSPSTAVDVAIAAKTKQ
jgi:hypothetical protein